MFLKRRPLRKALASVMLFLFLFGSFPADIFAGSPYYYFGDARRPVSPIIPNFSHNSFSGGFNYNYNIVTPPGRNNLGADLKLSYSNQNKDNHNIYGYGWSDNIPYIERINKTGTNNLYEENYYYSSVDGEISYITSTTTEQYLSFSAASLKKSDSKRDELLAKGLAFQKIDGSVELYEPLEDKAKRKENSKTYIKGFTKNNKEIYSARFYSGKVHYYDEGTREYKDINTELVEDENSWKMEKAQYKAELKEEIGNNFIKFSNKTQNIYFSLFNEPKNKSKGILIREGSQKNKEVLYKNAVNNIDIEVSLNNEYLIKDFIINNFDALGNIAGKEYYELPFLLTSDNEIDIEINGKLLSEERSIVSGDSAKIIDSDGITSYIWDPRAIDSSDVNPFLNISIRYEFKKDGIYLTKLIPTKWLNEAKFPVRADTTISLFSSNGDGIVTTAPYPGTWDLQHAATTGGGVNYTSSNIGVFFQSYHFGGQLQIRRAYFAFDTSDIPDGATINSAQFKSYGETLYTEASDAYSYIGLVGASQESTTQLVTTDIDNIGTTSLANNISVSSLTTSGYNSWSLNATGIESINKTGWTKLGLREGHDLENNTTTISSWIDRVWKYVGASFYASEEIGIDKDPYLEIVFTPDANAPTPPTSLLVEGKTNPNDITVVSPKFSAIYDDPNSGDNAIYYQLQVTATSSDWTNLVWGTEKTLMATTTEGNRCDDVEYAGDDLVMDIPVYYWRIKFWDDENNDGEWSDGSDNFIPTKAYGAKIDSGNFNRYNYVDNEYWEMTDKGGNIYKFGSATTTRQDNIDDDTQINKWLLEEIRDTNDNYIKYEYYKDDGQIYPSKITYTGNGETDGIYEIEFLREVRSDNMESFFPGFSVVTNYRVYEIDINVNGDLVRKYELDYGSGDNSHRSMLSNITESGVDELSNTITLPSTDFNYQTKELGWDSDANWTIPRNFVDFGPKDAGTRLADINGDGLTDIVYGKRGTRGVYIHNGSGWDYDSNWIVPEDFIVTTSLDDAGTRLADVNGDGLVDMLRGKNDSNVVYINDGDSWNLDTNWVLPRSFIIYGIDDAGTRIVDVNGDGLVDIIWGKNNDRGVYLNSGSNWIESDWTLPKDFIDYGPSDSSMRIADVNGDGLIDLVYGKRGTRGVYINNGNGWDLDANWTFPRDFIVTTDLDDASTRLADLNSDGLTDIVYGKLGTRGVYINNGKGWDYDSSWTVPDDFVNTSSEDNGLRIFDANADGIMDLLKNNYGTTATYLGKNNSADLLSTINDSKGASTTIEYKSAHLYLDSSDDIKNPDLFFPIQTVYKTHTNDGLGNVSSITYDYENADFYYDSNNVSDRRFSGFNKAKETNDYDYYQLTYYHQGNDGASTTGEYEDNQSKIGRIYRAEIYDDSDNLFSKSISKWENYDLGDDRDFVKMTEVIEFSYDGDVSHKERASAFSYDNDNGNLLTQINYGEVSGSDDGGFSDTGTDLASTTISYSASSSPYIIGLKSSETTYDYNDNKVKETKYYYDDLTSSNVDKGNLTKTEFWKDGANYINTENTYNSYGLITQTKDPRDKATNFIYDSYNLFVATSTNPLSQSTQYYYDYSLGKAKETIDPNNRTFETVFDGVDRIIEIKQPDVDSPSTSVTKTEITYYDSLQPGYVKEINYLNSATSTEKYIYLDGLGRTVQERVEAEDVNIFSVKDIDYNKVGLVGSESLSYFSAGSASTTATTTESLYTSYTYDALKRVKTSVNAIATTSYAYDDWKNTITDGENNTKSLYKDAYGNLVQVDEVNGVSTYETVYDYNLLGNLTKITDALSNERNFSYDGLGRLLTVQDLHAPSDSYYGTTTYAYDDSGNITSKIDQSNQTINYTYDDINRVVTEDYTGDAGTEIEYGYDTCTEGVGRLCVATSTSAITNYLYNALGLIDRETRTINSIDHVTEYSYDRLGNIKLLTTPDNGEVKYMFNDAGLLEKVDKKEFGEANYTSVLTGTDYNPLGFTSYEAYANGVESNYTYDADELYRLKNKVTIKSGVNLQNFNYYFDSVGNITKIDDYASSTTAKIIEFGYDDLYRLTSASTTNASSTDYTRTYAYNAIGNITNKSDQGNYTYSGHTGASLNLPYAVNDINGMSYSYDNNGNLISDSSWNNGWDYRNRLIESGDGTATTSYAYDHDVSRVEYDNGTNITYYPNKYYNVSMGTTTKHIFAGDKLIATTEGNGTATSTYYTHTDHLSGSNIITDNSGNIIQSLDYYPFGDIRVNDRAGNFDEKRKFTGHEHDDKTDLDYMEARYYNGNIGRFISADYWEGELTNPQSLNKYSYANNNPIRYNDPSGNSAEDPWQQLRRNSKKFSLMGESISAEIQGIADAIKIAKIAAKKMIEVLSGDAGDYWEVTTGRTVFGEELSTDERIVSGVFSASFILSGKIYRVVKDALKKLGKKVSSWGRASTLEKHFNDHGRDFNASSAQAYSEKATNFFRESQKNNYETIVGTDGTIRVYDKSTNTFGSYNPNGSTKTFYKPSGGENHWNNQKSNSDKNSSLDK